jgi:hypothetical protein
VSIILRHNGWPRPLRDIRRYARMLEPGDSGDGGLAVISWGMQIGVIWVPADHWFNGPIEFITPKTVRSVPAACQPSLPAPAEESLATNCGDADTDRPGHHSCLPAGTCGDRRRTHGPERQR